MMLAFCTAHFASKNSQPTLSEGTIAGYVGGLSVAIRSQTVLQRLA